MDMSRRALTSFGKRKKQPTDAKGRGVGKCKESWWKA